LLVLSPTSTHDLGRAVIEGQPGSLVTTPTKAKKCASVSAAHGASSAFGLTFFAPGTPRDLGRAVIKGPSGSLVTTPNEGKKKQLALQASLR